MRYATVAFEPALLVLIRALTGMCECARPALSTPSQASAPVKSAAFLTTLFGGGDKMHLPYAFNSWARNGPAFHFYIATPIEQLRVHGTENVHFVTRPLQVLNRALLDQRALNP